MCKTIKGCLHPSVRPSVHVALSFIGRICSEMAGKLFNKHWKLFNMHWNVHNHPEHRRTLFEVSASTKPPKKTSQSVMNYPIHTHLCPNGLFAFDFVINQLLCHHIFALPLSEKSYSNPRTTPFSIPRTIFPFRFSFSVPLAQIHVCLQLFHGNFFLIPFYSRHSSKH